MEPALENKKIIINMKGKIYVYLWLLNFLNKDNPWSFMYSDLFKILVLFFLSFYLYPQGPTISVDDDFDSVTYQLACTSLATNGVVSLYWYLTNEQLCLD